MLVTVTVKPGEEVLESIGRQLKAVGVTDGAIVSLIGAVDTCRISNMAKTDHRENIMIQLRQPLELSGTGEIKAGKVHIHCTISGENHLAMGGHLHWAEVHNHFVNAYVLPTAPASTYNSLQWAVNPIPLPESYTHPAYEHG